MSVDLGRSKSSVASWRVELMLIGRPTNQTFATSDNDPLCSAVILFSFLDQLMSLVHVSPLQLRRFTVDSESSSPLFSVSPTFCSVDVKPDVTGSCRVSSRSCVFVLYQSMLPDSRLFSTS